MRKICAVRFDDICPTMDWEEFNKAIDLMDKYNIKPLLGIIPDNKDSDQMIDDAAPDFWEKIRKLQEKGYSIALHGCYHVYDNKHRGMIIPFGKKETEFSGHSLEEQIKKIKHGRNILERHGVHTDIFFAPSHNYDRNTLKALRQCGFRFLSDGKSNKPYMQEGIMCIPCRFFGVPKPTNNGYKIAVCHTSKWKEYPQNYEALKTFIEQNIKYFVPFSDLIKEKSGLYYVQKTSEILYILFYDGLRRYISKYRTLRNLYKKFRS